MLRQKQAQKVRQQQQQKAQAKPLDDDEAFFDLLNQVFATERELQSRNAASQLQFARDNPGRMQQLAEYYPASALIGLRYSYIDMNDVLTWTDADSFTYIPQQELYTAHYEKSRVSAAIWVLSGKDIPPHLSVTKRADFAQACTFLKVMVQGRDPKQPVPERKIAQLKVLLQLMKLIEHAEIENEVCFVQCLGHFVPQSGMPWLRSRNKEEAALNMLFDCESHSNSDGSMSIRTKCMGYFGKPELQIKRTQATKQEAAEFLFRILAGYVRQKVLLEDGEVYAAENGRVLRMQLVQSNPAESAVLSLVYISNPASLSFSVPSGFRPGLFLAEQD